jgi:hypothetical protein
MKGGGAKDSSHACRRVSVCARCSDADMPGPPPLANSLACGSTHTPRHRGAALLGGNLLGVVAAVACGGMAGLYGPGERMRDDNGVPPVLVTAGVNIACTLSSMYD